VTPASSLALEDDIMGSLSTAVTTPTVAGVSSLAPNGAPVVVPVCGNGQCEFGEVCGADDTDCCIADCPNRYIECPTLEGNTMPCSGRGECDASTGLCSCMLGHTGADCSQCQAGFLLTLTGTTVVCNNVAIPSQAPAPVEPETPVEPDCVGMCKLSGGAIALIAFLGMVAFVAVVILFKVIIGGDDEEQEAIKAKTGVPMQSAAQYTAGQYTPGQTVMVPAQPGFQAVAPSASASIKAGRSGLTTAGSFTASMHQRGGGLAPIAQSTNSTNNV